MRERGEGPVHVVANVLRRGVSTTTGRGVECARYALHEGHTHELLSSIANVLGDPRIVGTSVATLRGVSVCYKAIENALSLRTPCTIGLKAKGGEGEATPFDVVAIFGYFLALLLVSDNARGFAHAASVG